MAVGFEKGLLIAAGVAFAGFVGYKIIKKKKPDVLKKAKSSISDIKKRTSEIVEGAKESFHEGYVSA
jgi:hypothetical protein